MTLWILLLFGLLAWGAAFQREGIAPDYLSRDGTNAVRGFFILLILGMHFTQYVSASLHPAAAAFRLVREWVDQLAVCMFLFYSGYGVALSFAEKGKEYRARFLRRRVLPTLLAYDVSVLLFYAAERLLGEGCTPRYLLRALLAWDSMGNDNWYIFVILGLYVLAWSGACASGGRPARMTALLTLGSAAFTLFLIAAGRREFWYNTMPCFPLGAAFYCLRGKIEGRLARPAFYRGSLLAALALFLLLHSGPWKFHFTLYMLTALCFALCVLLLTMKLSVRNRLLMRVGEHLNALFLVHRLPMRILGELSFVRERVYLYFALSVALALVCAWTFERLLAPVRRRLMQ